MKKKSVFDKEKAYYFRRQGVISGGRCSVQIIPEEIVECYEEVITVKEFEDGMRDRGAHLYFSGLKEGIAKVTIIRYYPTCEPEELSFILKVDKNLCVTRMD